MANNRMFLVNRRTGQRVRIAKYYPSTGWQMEGDTPQRVNAAFDADDALRSMGGSTDWEVDYELTED